MAYVKTIWAKGETITATKLNNNEYGTEKNSIQLINSQLENIGHGVQTGLNVQASATADMNVHVQTGTIYLPSGERFSYSSVTTKAITASDGTNPRKDIIYVSATGVIAYVAGTPGTTPAEPTLPSGAHKLCVIDVPAGDLTIEQAQITDTRTLKKAVAYSQDLNTHLADKTNPHAVTKAQVGLGSVDNVQQATKTEFTNFKKDMEILYWMGAI